MIRLAALSEIDIIWPLISEGMAECCRRSGGDITPDWLFMVARRGDALMYVIDDGKSGALIGQPQVWDGQRVFRVIAMTGRGIGRWLGEMIGGGHLRPLGVSKAIFEGRRGWERAIPNVRVLRQVYELDIDHGR